MKFNLYTFFLFILSSLAPLPIFFDLSNLTVIFSNSRFDIDPLIPLPISFIFFVLVFLLNLPSILYKLSNKRFTLLSFLIFLLSVVMIINGASLIRLAQIILPFVLILSIPGVVNSFNIYCAYAFVLSLSTFSILHFIYYFTNIDSLICTYNCSSIFLGYEIYHAFVGYPDVVLIVVSSTLILSQNKKDSIKQLFFIALALLLLLYAVFVAKIATLLSIFVSVFIFSLIQFGKLLFTSKINKTFLFTIIALIIFLIINGEPVLSALNSVYGKIFDFGKTPPPRLIIYQYFFEKFLENPISIIFGGLSKEISGHNYFFSMLYLVGLFGITIIFTCYSIAFSQLSKSLELKFIKLNSIHLYALTLAFSTIFIGNFVNDSITQPFNIIVIFIFFIFSILLLTNKNHNLKTSSKDISNIIFASKT